MDTILTLFVALVLYTGVAFCDIMKILSFSYHIHFFMVLSPIIVPFFVVAVFYIYMLNNNTAACPVFHLMLQIQHSSLYNTVAIVTAVLWNYHSFIQHFSI
jgi:hypothetical protein